jgi:competence protein ComFB
MGEIHIRNYMEDVVLETIDGILNEINCCSCAKCKLDISAIALNSLPPKYVVTRRGQLYTKLAALQNQFDVDIIAAITKAAVLVSRNPRHNEEY